MQQLKEIKEKIPAVLEGGEVLLIVPPFASIKTPMLAPHILQSIANLKGFKAEILYLNILIASSLGLELTNELSHYYTYIFWPMIQERLFAGTAYGLPPLGQTPEYCNEEAKSIKGSENEYVKTRYNSRFYDLEKYKKIENLCSSFLETVVPEIANYKHKFVGCTIRIGQTNASIAILNRLKQYHPDTITIIGGANCEGEMAEGIASLSDSIDYIFSGEGEISFGKFLEQYSQEKIPTERIIAGEPLQDLDSLPLSNYDAFFHQEKIFLGTNSKQGVGIAYETSRGCWWGQKKKCRFCGITNEMFRSKTAKKVLEDLTILNKRYPDKTIAITDNIMPFSFHKELIPLLSRKEYSNIHNFQRTNLNLKEIFRLRAAKIDFIMAGIEAFSTSLLKLINKGATSSQNLSFLRNAFSAGINLYWVLLWGFPGDKSIHYEETLKLLPLLRHLQPPQDIIHLHLNRFSTYFLDQHEYGIRNLRPWAVYKMIYPRWANIDKLAFFFTADYPCDSHKHPELIQELFKEWELWKKVWEKSSLVMIPTRDFYMIYDNRAIDGSSKKHRVEKQQAGEVMRSSLYTGSEALKWAVEEKLGVVVDSRYVPLVTASPRLLLKFEEENES